MGGVVLVLADDDCVLVFDGDDVGLAFGAFLLREGALPDRH